MTQVWVLSQGNGYDGYIVEGVFSKKEDAESFMAKRKLPKNDVWELECWEINGECVSSEFIH